MSRWLPRVSGQGAGGGGGGGAVISSTSVNLAADTSTVATAPVYATLMTLGLVTVQPASELFVLFTCGIRQTGILGVTLAANFRFRLNGILIAPGGGNTVGLVTNAIDSLSYSRRVSVAAGLQTVDVEWAKFGGVGQTLRIDPVSLPDLNHAHLLLQEQT